MEDKTRRYDDHEDQPPEDWKTRNQEDVNTGRQKDGMREDEKTR